MRLSAAGTPQDRSATQFVFETDERLGDRGWPATKITAQTADIEAD